MAPDSVAFIVGATPVTRSADTEYPFRQNSDFWYLTGFEHPNAVAVLRKGAGPSSPCSSSRATALRKLGRAIDPGVEGARRPTTAPTRRTRTKSMTSKELPDV